MRLVLRRRFFHWGNNGTRISAFGRQKNLPPTKTPSFGGRVDFKKKHQSYEKNEAEARTQRKRRKPTSRLVGAECSRKTPGQDLGLHPGRKKKEIVRTKHQNQKKNKRTRAWRSGSIVKRRIAVVVNIIEDRDRCFLHVRKMGFH